MYICKIIQHYFSLIFEVNRKYRLYRRSISISFFELNISIQRMEYYRIALYIELYFNFVKYFNFFFEIPFWCMYSNFYYFFFNSKH